MRDGFPQAARDAHRDCRRWESLMIPFLDLKAQYRSIGTELEAVALDVLRSGEYVQGRHVAAFEENFAAFCGAEHAVAVNTGTSALHLALLAIGSEPYDARIAVPMTFAA